MTMPTRRLTCRAALCIVVVLIGHFSSGAQSVAQTAVPFRLLKQPVVTDLTVPVAMRFGPNGEIFVAEKYGDLKVVRDEQVHTLGSINVNADYEQGLLGLVLDPEFSTNRHLYVAYTLPDGNSNRISRLTVSATNPNLLEPNSEKILLDGIPSPTGIHQVGELQIGPDGKLYVPSGDGAIDAQVAQRLDSLGGKMLRINLDGSIPTDNPFYGQTGMRAEIWAYGLRNPFTSDVQPGTGRIFVNDVGKDDWEEINELQRGANYGWTTCEGRCNPTRADFTDPIYQYNHYTGDVVGRSIAGAAWYQGSAYPEEFTGDYFFADYVAGWIKKLDPVTLEVVDIASDLTGLVNLKVGPDGLLYYVQLDVTTGSGAIGRLAVADPDESIDRTEIKVFAAGTPALGVYPTAELLVDDIVVATFTDVRGNIAARQFVEYTHTVADTVTPDRVKVRYPNDYYAPNEDRNLYVDKISLNGVTYQSEDPSVLSTGSYTPETGCAPGNKQSEGLECGGYFHYAPTQPDPTPPPTNGSTLKIYAAGQPAQGVYPTLEVLVGGSVVKIFSGIQGDHAARNFQELIYASDSVFDISQLRLRFPNDVFVNGEDRNLIVDKVVLDGVVYETENPSVYSVGSWNAATGCSGGYKQSEILSCNGYFSFEPR